MMRAARSAAKKIAFASVSSCSSTSDGTTLKSVVTPHSTSTVPSRKPMTYSSSIEKTPPIAESGIAMVSAMLETSHAMSKRRLSTRSMSAPAGAPKRM